MKAWRLLLGYGLCLGASACSLANDRRPCDDVPKAEGLLNQKQDHEEFLSRVHGAVVVDDSRLFTAFTSQVWQDDTLESSSVRYAIVSRVTGAPLPCGDQDYECEMADAGELPRPPTVARAPLPIDGDHAAALVAWIQGSFDGKSYARMRFIDTAGAPIGAVGVFDPFGMPMQLLDVAWSEAAQKVVAVAHDNRQIWIRLFDSPRPGDSTALASGTTSVKTPLGIIGVPTLAVAEDGRMLVGWFDAVHGYQVLALDAQGEPQGKPRSAGIPGAVAQPNLGVALAIAAGSDRFALVGSSSNVKDAPLVVFFQEFSLDGEPLREARAVNPEDAAHQTLPNAVYLNQGTLLVTWHSSAHHGVVGRFFDADGRPRFCALGCDEGPFELGARTAGSANSASAPLLNHDDVWLVHDGEDGFGTGIHLLRSPFSALYPAKP